MSLNLKPISAPAMPRRTRIAAQRGSALRRDIASRAARLMAEDGVADYGFAKRKAARQLGVAETEALPGNDEVEAELRAYLALYQEDEQAQRLHHLRGVALEVMRLLERFSPYLTGAVLNGTAGRYAQIEIALFADSAKEVEIFLLGRDIACRHDGARRAGSEAPEAVLELDWGGEVVQLAVFNALAERGRPRNPHTGRSPERASIGAVEALLAKG
jgi:hypothetical protein